MSQCDGGDADWICDLCGGDKAGTVWRCSQDKRWGQGGGCDYDVCTGCALEYQVGGGGDSPSSCVLIVRSRRRRIWWWKMTPVRRTLRRQQVVTSMRAGLVVISAVGPGHQEGPGGTEADKKSGQPPLTLAGSSSVLPVRVGLLL